MTVPSQPSDTISHMKLPLTHAEFETLAVIHDTYQIVAEDTGTLTDAIDQANLAEDTQDNWDLTLTTEQADTLDRMFTAYLHRTIPRLSQHLAYITAACRLHRLIEPTVTITPSVEDLNAIHETVIRLAARIFTGKAANLLD